MGGLFCMRMYTRYVNEGSAACRKQTGQTADNPPFTGETSLASNGSNENGTNMFASQGGKSWSWIFIKWPFSHGSVNYFQLMKLCDLTCSQKVYQKKKIIRWNESRIWSHKLKVNQGKDKRHRDSKDRRDGLKSSFLTYSCSYNKDLRSVGHATKHR